MYRKYKNKKTVQDGITFDSAAEARRYAQLQVMERAGQIHNLQRQVPFELIPTLHSAGGTVRKTIYKADFVYTSSAGKKIVEDVKGVRTPVYSLKKKLLLWQFGIEIKEVKA